MSYTMLMGSLEFAALATAYVAVCIILSGLVSGIVALGIVQAYGRERIQRSVLDFYFRAVGPGDILGRGEGSEVAASLLAIPAPTLCRLYYRQVAGLFLAAVNGEASRAAQAQVSYTTSPPPTPVMDMLTNAADRSWSGSSKVKDERLHEAVRQIDCLQARLGDAVSRTVMKVMFIVWEIFYIVIGMAAFVDLRGQAPQIPFFDTLFGQAVEIVLAFLFISALAGMLAVSAAACGLIAFGALDRFVASR